MNKTVEQKMGEMLEVFENLPNCRIEKGPDDRVMIASNRPVPWSDALDAEVSHKIGYITPHKAALGLYIDFPHGSLDIAKVEKIVDPDITLAYYPPGEKALTTKSWWRFRSDEKFDSLHLVLRKIELELYDFKREEWVGLMGEITGVGG